MANESKASSISRDVLTGDRFGLLLLAEAQPVTRDVLTGDRVGLTISSEVSGVARDVLTGDGYGALKFAEAVMVVREVLIQEPPFRAATVVRESLFASQNEPVSVQRVITGYAQSVAMARPTMVLPSTVRSLTSVPSLREHVVQRAVRPWAISDRFAGTLRMSAVIGRIAMLAPSMHSTTRLGTVRQQIVTSRGKTYVPVSALYAAAQRQLVVSHRVVTLAPDVRTPINVDVQRQQIVLSRKTVIVTMTEAHVGQYAQQVLQATGRPAPHSPTSVRKLARMVVQRHTVIPPGIDDRAATLRQQIVVRRVPTPPRADDIAATLGQQVVAQRAVGPQWSTTIAAGGVMLALQHRITYPPQYAMGRHAAAFRQQVLQHRQVPPYLRSTTRVSILRVSYTMRRIMPAPWDVIDPTIGRHAFTLSMLSVQHRVTVPPGKIHKESRVVYGVNAQVAIRATFPAPNYPPEVHETFVNSVNEQVVLRDRGAWSPVSTLTALSVGSNVVIGDATWIDASLPQSEVQASGVMQSLAVGATFPDLALAQSAAEVATITQAVAFGDPTMPDPALPQSVVEAAKVGEIAALGDARFPDPLIPLSEVRSSLLRAFCMLGDANLSGRFAMSEISTESVAEFVVLRDRSLVGVPLRKGPRPVISVSMT